MCSLDKLAIGRYDSNRSEEREYRVKGGNAVLAVLERKMQQR